MGEAPCAFSAAPPFLPLFSFAGEAMASIHAYAQAKEGRSRRSMTSVERMSYDREHLESALRPMGSSRPRG